MYVVKVFAVASAIQGFTFISLPEQSSGRGVALPLASALASASVSALARCQRFYAKVFYVIGKVLIGKLSCPCDRS